jgi:hypothetical protein
MSSSIRGSCDAQLCGDGIDALASDADLYGALDCTPKSVEGDNELSSGRHLRCAMPHTFDTGVALRPGCQCA